MTHFVVDDCEIPLVTVGLCATTRAVESINVRKYSRGGSDEAGAVSHSIADVGAIRARGVTVRLNAVLVCHAMAQKFPQGVSQIHRTYESREHKVTTCSLTTSNSQSHKVNTSAGAPSHTPSSRTLTISKAIHVCLLMITRMRRYIQCEILIGVKSSTV
jgi:hypothetical protein